MRPIPPDVPESQLSWDGPVDDRFRIIYDAPVPLATYVDFASLPAASSFERSLAFAGGSLYFSNGLEWSIVGGTVSKRVLLHSEDLTASAGGQQEIQVNVLDQWQIFNTFIVELQDIDCSEDFYMALGFYDQEANGGPGEDKVGIRQGSTFSGSQNITFSGLKLQGSLPAEKRHGFSIQVPNSGSLYRGILIDDAYGFDTSGNTVTMSTRKTGLRISVSGTPQADSINCIQLETFRNVAEPGDPVDFQGTQFTKFAAFFNLDTGAGQQINSGKFNIYGF